MFWSVIKKTVAVLRIVYFVTAQILIDIGSWMQKKNNRYLFISSIIENLFGSIEIYLKVRSVSVHPLYVRFETEISSSFENKINWPYFIKELVCQLGCSYSDINIDFVRSNKDYKTYNVDITKSAISFLEKGTTYTEPQIFEKKNTEWLMQKAIQLSVKENFSPELLDERLNIGPNRAKELYNQLIKAEAFISKSKSKTVN